MRARDGLEQQRQRMRGKIIAAMDGERPPGGKNTTSGGVGRPHRHIVDHDADRSHRWASRCHNGSCGRDRIDRPVGWSEKTGAWDSFPHMADLSRRNRQLEGDERGADCKAAWARTG